MKIAVMQPYLFPYIGYFQLIKSVDTFVFYDDVNFIKGGWINRNKLLVQGKELIFTVPLNNASSFSTINETTVNISIEKKWRVKFLRTVEQSYGKATHFEEVFRLIKSVFESDYEHISELAINSIKVVSGYLGLTTNFQISSQEYSSSKNLDRTERLLAICKELRANNYINMLGGKEIYDKDTFLKEGINLQFLKPELIPYNKDISNFVPGLSIIDVLMHNSKDEVNNLIKYSLL